MCNKAKAVLALCALGLTVWAGCRSGGPVRDASRDGTAPEQPGVDVTRAYLRLSNIEPRIEKPARPPALKPLSERAARQIPKARKLIAEQRYTEAAIELERALRFDPKHPTIHRTLATLHWEAGNLERSRRHAERAIEINGDDATSYYIRGRYFLRMDDYASAMRDLRTAILCSDFTGHPQVAALCHFYLAKALTKEGYLEAALGQFTAYQKKIAKLDHRVSDPDLLALMDAKRRTIGDAKARIHETLGRFALAAAELAPIAAEAPGDLGLQLRYARLLQRAGRFAEALAVARAIPSSDDQVIELLFEIHSDKGNPESVLDDLRLRVSRAPENPTLVLQLSRMMGRLARNHEARVELERFLSGHPDDDAVRTALIDVLINGSAWTEAVQVCAEGIERDPGHTKALTARVAVLASDPKALDELVTAHPSAASPMVAFLTGKLAAEAGRFDDGERWLRLAVEAQTEFVPARVALARLLLDTYRYDDAIQVAKREDEDVPEDAELELLLGEVYDRRDEIVPAEMHLQAAIQLDRADRRATLALAELFRQSGHMLRSQRQLLALLDQDPDHEIARELLAYSYLREGKRDVAIEHFVELNKRAQTPTVKARCTALLEHVFKRDPQLAAFREALLDTMEKHGQDATIWLSIAESYDVERQPRERADAYESALAVDPQNEDAAIGFIDASARLLDFEEAARRFESLLRMRPNRHRWRLSTRDRAPGLIDLYWIIQDFDAAIRLLEEMETRKDLKPTWRRRYRMAMIDTLRFAQRSDEIITRLTDWSQDESDGQLYKTVLAEEHLSADRAVEAVPLLESVYENAADDRRTLATLATALVKSGQPDRAAQHALDWLADDPESNEAIAMLAGILGEAERVDGALELVRNRLLDTLDRERFQNILITLLVRSKRYDDCIDQIELLIDQVLAISHVVQDLHARAPKPFGGSANLLLLPNEPFTADRLHLRLAGLRGLLATVLITAEEYDAAADRLKAWLDQVREPQERMRFLRILADCHRAQGDERSASEVIAGALALQPDHPGLNNDVAYGWIDRGVRLDESDTMIRFALSRSPRQAAYLDTYGWLLYKKGAFQEAKKWLLRARGAFTGSDPVIHDHLGDLFWRLGFAEQAIESWEAGVAAVRDRDEGRMSSDQRRVRDTTQQKIDDARAKREPSTASLALPHDEVSEESAPNADDHD